MAITSDKNGTAVPSNFCVGPGMFIGISYCVRDAEGELIGPDSERIECVFGMGQLLPKIEQAIDGLRVGGVRKTKLVARDAYGPRDPEAVLEVERGEFPPDVAPGDYYEVENADEGLLVLRVLEVEPEFVLVDLNHPLAGQDLDVEIRVETVRPATQEEMDLAMKVGLEAEESEGQALIAPESLLRGPKRR